MKRDKKWQKFEDYIAEELKEIDPYCRASKGSGNKGELHDIRTNCGLGIECKQRNTKDVTVRGEWWKHICEEIPLHANKIPMLALENEKGKRWAVLDLDDFLEMYKELYKYRQGDV